jgi:hypothetical protein
MEPLFVHTDPAVMAGLQTIAEAAGSDALVAAKCSALLVGYYVRWRSNEYLIDQVEQLVTAPLYNPDTNGRSRTFRFAGKLDITGWDGERRMLMDHKTTSDEIHVPDAPYWRQLAIEAQPSHYMYMEWLNGRKVDLGVWDVVRKPGIAPRQLTKKQLDEVFFERSYLGLQLRDEDLEALTCENRETPLMYAQRLVLDCTVERPERYFQRRSVPRLDRDIFEHATEVWEHGQEIIHARANSRHARNSGACMNFNSPCKFLGICSGYDSPDSDRWRRKSQVHVELEQLEGDGRDVLTNSRIKSYLTCRRKHYYEYELGIERVEEEEREALFFGTVWHQGLEQYFLKIKEQQNECDISSPVDQAGTSAAAEVHA